MSDLLRRYSEIRTQVERAAAQAGRTKESVKLIAVSKVQPFEKIEALYHAGHRDFGENYAQELVEKSARARAAGFTEIRWHFIGHLQSNKVKMLLPHTSVIHGVSSLRLAEEISKRAENTPIPVFLEVNVDGEESKSGVQISELRSLAEQVSSLPNIELRGLMCIPDPERAAGPREAFSKLAALERDLRPFTRGELSMGMTSDFTDAIAEGATCVRIGTAIFGDRSPREKL
jgi:pyridoxal phosphate enzyme (YggS family)